MRTDKLSITVYGDTNHGYEIHHEGENAIENALREMLFAFSRDQKGKVTEAMIEAACGILGISPVGAINGAARRTMETKLGIK